ncbi:MAG TPA: YciI family protein [Jatrophihabitantaceae bacterium]|nr:YciI family protein [Jatrophihabitantaceae bacterium]
MKFLIMVKSNPTSLARWDTLTDEEKEQFGRAHFALTDALFDSGQLITSEGLAPVETARQVRVHDGAIVATDGPFAEAKEHLAGFYLVECTDMDEAVTIAARVPDAAFNHVEVRPVFDRSVLDE